MIKTMRQLIKSLEERHGQSSSAAVSEIHSVAGVWDMISGRSSINCRPAKIGKTTPARDQSKPSTVNNITSDVIADI